MSSIERSVKRTLTDEDIGSTRNISRRSVLASTGLAITASVFPVVAITAERGMTSNNQGSPVGLKDSDLTSGVREKGVKRHDDFNFCRNKPLDLKGHQNNNSTDPKFDTDIVHLSGDCNSYDSEK